MINRQDTGLGELLQYENVAWYEDGAVKILDRRIYPSKKAFVECRTYKEVIEAIQQLVTQSAGPYTAAGMGMALAAYQTEGQSNGSRLTFLETAAKELGNARPTTSKRMLKVTEKCFEVGKEALEQGLSPVDKIFNHVIDTLNMRYQKMDKVGKSLFQLLEGKTRILTHCFGETNIGMLLRNATDKETKMEMYCSETRPFSGQN